MVNIEKISSKTKKNFQSDKEILFAYLFGSYAKNDTSPRSDLDLAVYLKESLSAEERFQKRLDLIGRLQELPPAPMIDLVCLNGAPVLLSFNVIHEGKLLCCRDELERIHFEAKTMSRFFDEQYYFQRHADWTIDRVAREGIL